MLKFFPFYDADLTFAEDAVENKDNILRFEITKHTGYDWYNAFRRMAGCPPVDPKEAEEKSKRSERKTEQITGLIFESSEELELAGRKYYVGNSTNADGETRFKIYAAEDMLHMPTSQWASLCWSFLKQFHRDPGSGKVRV